VERLMRTLMTGTKMLSTFSLRREINAGNISFTLLAGTKTLHPILLEFSSMQLPTLFVRWMNMVEFLSTISVAINF